MTLERIQAAIRQLAELPYRGRPGRWPGTRELIVARTPDVAPYRAKGQVVEILRVFHGARRWPDEPAVSEDQEPVPWMERTRRGWIGASKAT
jgi:toxin ParE1/3/4